MSRSTVTTHSSASAIRSTAASSPGPSRKQRVGRQTLRSQAMSSDSIAAAVYAGGLATAPDGMSRDASRVNCCCRHGFLIAAGLDGDRQVAVERLVAAKDEELHRVERGEVGPLEDIGHVVQRDRLPDVHAHQHVAAANALIGGGTVGPHVGDQQAAAIARLSTSAGNRAAGIGFSSRPSTSQAGLAAGFGRLGGLAPA